MPRYLGRAVMRMGLVPQYYARGCKIWDGRPTPARGKMGIMVAGNPLPVEMPGQLPKQRRRFPVQTGFTAIIMEIVAEADDRLHIEGVCQCCQFGKR